MKTLELNQMETVQGAQTMNCETAIVAAAVISVFGGAAGVVGGAVLILTYC